MTGKLNESFGVGGQAKVTGLGEDEGGSIYYQRLTYENVIIGGATLSQTYENGHLSSWTYGFESQPIISLKCGNSTPCMNQDGSIYDANVEIHSTPIDIQGPQSPAIDNLILRLNIFQGKIAEASVEAKPSVNSVEVPPASNAPVDAKDRRTYLLNGIGNVDPVEDGAPQYMVNLRNILRDTYNFTNTALVGLYEGVDFPGNFTNNVLDFDLWLRQLIFPLGYPSDTMKIINKILNDISSGIVKAGDTINVIAYSGAGQRLIDASWFLPVNINLIAYGAPIIAAAIPARVKNIFPIWGKEDEFKGLEPFIRFAIAPGNIFSTEWLTGVHHADFGDKKGYHCDDISICNNNGKTYLETLAEKIDNFFSSLNF